MRRAKRTLVVMAFTLVSCSSQIVPAATPTTQQTTLRLYATTSVLPLVNDLTAAYTRLYPNITFDIGSGDHDAMMRRLRAGEISYFLTNHLPQDETGDLWAAPVGQDGVAVIVSPENTVSGLTTTQLRSIFQGWADSWRAFGGVDERIVVISREDGSGTRAEFESLVMGDRRTTRTAQIAPSSAAMIRSVRRQAGAVGYVSAAYVDETVRALPINGVALTQANVLNNTYPLRTILYVVGLQEPQGEFRQFIGWVQSPDGQAVVGQRYAPLGG